LFYKLDIVTHFMFEVFHQMDKYLENSIGTKGIMCAERIFVFSIGKKNTSVCLITTVELSTNVIQSRRSSVR